MKAIPVSDITLTRLNQIALKIGSSTENFIVCKDFQWNYDVIGKSYRTDFAAIILCKSGHAKLQFNLKERNMTKDCLMIYGPNNIIKILDKSDDIVLDMILFNFKAMDKARFDLDMIVPIYNYVADEKNDLMQLEAEESNLIQQYYNLIRESMQFGKSLIISELVAVMFRTISELYTRRIDIDINHNKTRQQEYFERFIKQVGMFYREERRVKFYADSLYITPKYLSTVIKEISGRSAAEWITEFVIQEAKVMLSYSTKSIQEITYNLNFSTQSFFGKYFKRHTGMSPSEFRAQKHS